jgi:hypothetical protein
MRSHRTPRLLVAALVVLLSLQLGSRCSGSGGGFNDPQKPLAGVHVEPVQVFYFSGGYFLQVDVQVSTGVPLQAFDLTLEWNTDVLEEISTVPGAGFDDDGQFFGSVDVDPVLGRAHFADLRHGSTGTTGEVTVASVWLLAASGGTANVSVEGTLASSAGVPFKFFSNDDGTFPLTP